MSNNELFPFSCSASSTSSDLNKPFKLGYEDGSTTSGDLVTDTVSIGGLTVRYLNIYSIP